MRGLFLYHAQRLADAIRFGIAWQIIIERHAVQFQELIPSCITNQCHHFAFVQRIAVLQYNVQTTIKKTPEMQNRIVHDLSGIMMFLDEIIANP